MPPETNTPTDQQTTNSSGDDAAAAAAAAATAAAEAAKPAAEGAVADPAAKAADATGAEATGAKTGEEKAEGDQAPVLIGTAPDTYDIHAPDGTTLDKAALDAFVPTLKALGATNEGAQAIFDAYAKDVMPKLAEAQATAANEQISAIRSGWADEFKADPELGGAHLPATQAVIAAAMDTFGTPELKQFLEDTGIGNNLAVGRFIYNVGKLVQEGTVRTSSHTVSTPKSTSELMYGDTFQPKAKSA